MRPALDARETAVRGLIGEARQSARLMARGLTDLVGEVAFGFGLCVG